ncbi:ArnT family glycosyltransferase [Occallatibacter savannae]|uniref:ArnT family glycosyltransferase n=1 Tax=Occallatibacter savannae TaxID=1002691 RepID=UPI001EF56A14|nr:glycosyltransferase family 39 protein [Occallatibacter savannae]
MDAPFPLWMVFPVIFASLYASHFSLLRLPYYWDEAGYYVPAAWDFFRTGSLIPSTTLSNAHPPLPSLYLALWWKLSGFVPEVTREAVLLIASFGLLAVWRLAHRLSGSGAVAFWTVLLTAVYPVWFAQSTLAQADIFAAAFSLWGLVYSLPDDRRPGLAALYFTAAVLAKETAIAIPVTLAAIAVIQAFRADTAGRTRLLKETAWLLSCALPLAGWYVWHYAKTGFAFGNPEFLRYNAQANFAPVRIVAAFGHRLLHLTAHMNMFVPTLLTVASLMLNPRLDREGREKPRIRNAALWRILVVVLANALLFSVLGGALLTRYLLAIYPLIILIAVSTFAHRVPYWPSLALLSAAAFISGLFINPPYRFAPEDNLEYARVIRLHMAGIAQLNKHFPGSTVLSAWPITDELSKPELGYVKAPYEVYRLDDFTEEQIEKASADPGGYSSALVFSTKYDPSSTLLTLGTRSQALDEQYFGLHHDLAPEAIALRLHGTMVWKREDHNQWIALLRFNRQFEASLQVLHPVRRAR